MKKGLRVLLLDSNPQRKQLKEELRESGLKENEIDSKLHIERFKFGGWRENPNSEKRLEEIIGEQLSKAP